MRDLKTMLQQHVSHLRQQQYQVDELTFAPPASEAELLALEAELGLALPASLRKVLGTLSSHVAFHWSAPPDTTYPAPFQSSFSGKLHWSLAALRLCEQEKKGWIANCFPDRDDACDAVWHDKLAFMAVDNGDYLAIDLAPDSHGTIVYLSHDDGEGHGRALAENMESLLDRWAPLACPGGEDWQWLPFCEDGGMITPDQATGRAWRAMLGLAP